MSQLCIFFGAIVVRFSDAVCNNKENEAAVSLGKK